MQLNKRISTLSSLILIIFANILSSSPIIAQEIMPTYNLLKQASNDISPYNTNLSSSLIAQQNATATNVLSNQKIGVIDLEKIFNQLKATHQLEKEFKSAIKKAETKLLSLEAKLKDEYKSSFNDQNNSQEDLQKSAKLYNRKVSEYQLLLREIKSNLMNLRNEDLKIIKQAVTQAIKTIALNKGLAIIIHKEQCAFHVGGMDISDDVLLELSNAKIKLHNLQNNKVLDAI